MRLTLILTLPVLRPLLGWRDVRYLHWSRGASGHELVLGDEELEGDREDGMMCEQGLEAPTQDSLSN